MFAPAPLLLQNCQRNESSGLTAVLSVWTDSESKKRSSARQVKVSASIIAATEEHTRSGRAPLALWCAEVSELRPATVWARWRDRGGREEARRDSGAAPSDLLTSSCCCEVVASSSEECGSARAQETLCFLKCTAHFRSPRAKNANAIQRVKHKALKLTRL